ncbi:efflux RND transporter periplasmic adaptor subunit [bacterium AH-315-F03]|nr:efflux RND transporter periplasmic adaptor subunit [bacterium AH-315-F03]
MTSEGRELAMPNGKFRKCLMRPSTPPSRLGYRSLLLVLCVGSALFVGCSSSEENTEAVAHDTTAVVGAQESGYVTAVIVTTIELRSLEFTFSSSEVCRGIHEAKLVAKRPGAIIAIPRRLGEFVRQGQEIILLDDELERLGVFSGEAALELMETSLAKAKVDLDRAKRLFADSLISESQMALAEIALRRARAETRRAEAELALAEKNLRECVVVAPFAGEITLLPFEIGETPTPGFAVAEVVDRSKLLVDLFVSQSDLKNVTVGASATARSSLFPDEKFVGAVRALSPKASENTKLFHVEIVFENPNFRLRSGMSVKIFIKPEHTTKQIRVPHATLIERNGSTYAPVAVGSYVSLKKVVLGGRIGGEVVVSSGLAVGEQLIVSGATRLVDGAEIEIMEEVSLDSILDK